MKQQRKRAADAGRPNFAALIAAWIAFVLIACGLYLYAEWHIYYNTMSRQATTLAESLEALIHPEQVETLLDGDGEERERRYGFVKASLARLTATQGDIHYAFLVAAVGDGFVCLADSADASASAAVPTDAHPGVTDAYRKVLADNESVFLPEITDARGKWVRVLVPVPDTVTGAPIALFGIDFHAQLWYEQLLARMRPDFAVALSMVLLFVALAALYISHARLRLSSARTAGREELLRGVLDQAPIGIAVSSDAHVVHPGKTPWLNANRMFGQILGRDEQELAQLKWRELSMPDDARAHFDEFLSGARAETAFVKEYVRPDGQRLWLNLMFSRLRGASFEGAFLCLVDDITGRRAVEEALRESERSKSVLLSHLPGMAYRCRYDRDWTMEFVSEGGFALTGYRADELVENRCISFNEVIAPEYREIVWDEWSRVASSGESFRFEYEIVKKSGERRWVYELGQSILDADGKIVALEGIIINITDRKVREQKIAFMSVHDHLTGLYDRPFIIEASARLDAEARVPVSVAVCDINGVRMVNLAFGNEEGDRLIADVGKIVASCARPGDLVGRTGGDEFTVILPGADLKEVGQIVRKIEAAVERFNRARDSHPYEISLSIGYDTKKSQDIRIEHAIKTAGESLMHAKLLNQKSSHSALLASIMATLYARNQETEEHGQRLARYARMVGGALGLSARVIDEMQLLCMLHDIGKIGIDDRILMKPDALTPEERKAMKRHSEIGHRIALASPEFAHIADYILHHHEKWDGTGYPTGLSGEEIPLQSRILAVCDAYDAMTEDRVYRRAMSSKDALAEIARCAGTQFDPVIAELFIKLTQEREEAST